jgi:thiol-disulfide isomerase/thioredoxin
VGAAGAGIGAALWQSGRNTARTAASQAEQAFWSLDFAQVDGQTLKASSLRGQPLLVNFWATWCPPCVKEMPLLDSFAQRHANQGWRVLGIAVDQLQPVRDFLQRLPVAFPIAMAGMEGLGLSRRLGNAGGQLPYSLVFDRTGQIAQRHLGAVNEPMLQDWIKQVG